MGRISNQVMELFRVARQIERFRAEFFPRSTPLPDQNDLICGYQRQDKSWVTDPNGVQWETFFTSGVVEGASYGSDAMPGEETK